MTDAPRRRRVFTEAEVAPDRVASAALDLVRESGVAALSMRVLADRVDLPLPTIYRIVGDRDGVLDLLVERIAVDVRAITPADASAHERAVLAYDHLVAMDGAAVILLERLPMTDSSLAYLADALPALGGDDDPLAAAIRWRVIWTYVVGSAAADRSRRRPPDVPDDLAPALAELLPVLVAIEPRDQFVAGLEVLLAGFGITPSSGSPA